MAQAGPLPPFSAVVVAAGQGHRAGQPVPKQFASWRGKPLVQHSVAKLLEAGANPLVVVIPDGAEKIAADALGELADKCIFAVGGATRQQSVIHGLLTIAGPDVDKVLIHDAARPDLPVEVIARLLDALTQHPGAIPVLSVVDSLAVDDGGVMSGKADRESLRRVQTPQAFRFEQILSAHEQWLGDPGAGDDAQVLRAAGGSIALVDGDDRLKKITFAGDFMNELPPMRVGQGFDVHRLAEGEELWLGGVKIEHDRGLAGHSDADVALHALVDALLGAIGEGDIGTHFPPSDERWRGAPSSRFVEHALSLVRQSGYGVGNVDLTIICEAPKIGPHRDAIRERLAQLLETELSRVSVKATTTERLGFTGRGEGIAAQAIVSLFAN